MTTFHEESIPDGVTVARIGGDALGSPPCDGHGFRFVAPPASVVRVTVKGRTLTRLFLCPKCLRELSRKLREHI